MDSRAKGLRHGGSVRWVRVGGIMRETKKNLRTIWYALYNDSIATYDEDGNPTFEDAHGYDTPVQIKANVSAGKSNLTEEPFGAEVQYDRVILLYDMDCPIDEHSLIWFKNEPKYFENGNVDPDSADYEVASAPLDSLNVIRIAIRHRVK